MFLKLPLEAEVPDEVHVGDYVLTCKQTSDWEAEYRDRTTQYSPSIDIDLAEGEISGYVSDNADPFTLRFSADGEWLYESIQTIAECMDNDMKGINKATKKSKTQPNKLRVKADMAFSEMVKKQRDKNLRKQVDSSGVEFGDTHISEIAEKVIKTANRIIELDAEIKEGYMESPQMPYDLMQELFSNIYSLDAYRQLLEDKYKIWVARFERE